MIKLKELETEWKEDCAIDLLDLAQASAKVPALHAKYVIHLSHAKLSLRKSQVEFYKMKTLRQRYYYGELAKEDLVVLNWDQYRNNRPLKAELEDLLMTDAHLVPLQDRVEYNKTLVDTLESILKAVHNQTWNIKNAITWTQYTNGAL